MKLHKKNQNLKIRMFTFFLIPIFTLKKTQNLKMRLILKNPLVCFFLVFYTRKPVSKKTVLKIEKLYLEIFEILRFSVQEKFINLFITKKL